MTYSEKIVNIIKGSGLKQVWIAARLGINKTNLSEYMNGHRKIPTKYIDEIIDLLGYELRLVKKGSKK